MTLFQRLFHRKPVPVLVEEELYEAQRELLKAEHGLEHYESLVSMYTARIERLQDHRANHDQPKEF